MTVYLQCSECDEGFEVSNAIAEARHHWRETSGDPFLCVECATEIEWGAAIIAMDENPVGGNSDSRLLCPSDKGN